MGQKSTNAVQWMREMESGTDAIDFDLHVDEKKREAVSLCFRLVVLADKTALGWVPSTSNRTLNALYVQLQFFPHLNRS
eukprot:4210700-Amphidinium_carterae.1